MSGKQQPRRKVKIVESEYQPSKAELEEDLRVDASFEELTEAVLGTVDIELADKPKQGD